MRCSQSSAFIGSAIMGTMLVQVQVEAAPPLDRFYRHPSKGAWPFSTQDHGWPISDCTSEGLKVRVDIQLPSFAWALAENGLHEAGDSSTDLRLPSPSHACQSSTSAPGRQQLMGPMVNQIPTPDIRAYNSFCTIVLILIQKGVQM